MHTTTLTGPTQLLCKHRVTEYKAALPYNPVTVRMSARWGFKPFSSDLRPNTHELIQTLEIASAPLTRKQLADRLQMPKSTVRDKVKELVKQRQVERITQYVNGRKTYFYQLPTTDPNPIRRSPYYWWRHCPVCNADRRLRWLPSGDWLHWCGEHYSHVISKERVK